MCVSRTIGGACVALIPRRTSRCWRPWSATFEGNWVRRGSREALLRKLDDSFSNLIQVSPTKGCLAQDPAKEIRNNCQIVFRRPEGAQLAWSGRSGDEF